ncbi:hypothetical protein IWW38_002930 [Coemansia aciculifera]|uniref:Uncharacterized protein n=1 Tax=Coemansia aciculifera TaxID=417176 RepID=A0ACC1M2J8_9FUNG|nr:hypothetical protein IWW38_002930 [Coemansia aciculifera]
MGHQIYAALKKPPVALRPDLKLFAVPAIQMDFCSVTRLLAFLPAVEQLEFQLPDQFTHTGQVAHTLAGAEWAEERRKFADTFAASGKHHPLLSVIVTGYHPDLHSAAVSAFLALFPDLESLAFTAVGREDHANIDQLAGVLTALNPDLSVSII